MEALVSVRCVLLNLLVLLVRLDSSKCQDVNPGTPPGSHALCWIPEGPDSGSGGAAPCSVTCGHGVRVMRWTCRSVALPGPPGEPLELQCWHAGNKTIRDPILRCTAVGLLLNQTMPCNASHMCSEFCPVSVMGNITWPSAKHGDTIRQRCPELRVAAATNATASRSCVAGASGLAMWQAVDWSECEQVDGTEAATTQHTHGQHVTDEYGAELANLATLLQRARWNLSESAVPVSEQLRNITRMYSTRFNQSQIAAAADLVDQLSKVSSPSEIINEVSVSILYSVSNLLDAEAVVLAQGQATTASSTKLLRAVDLAVSKLQSNTTGRKDIDTPNLAVSVVCLDPTSFEGMVARLEMKSREQSEANAGSPTTPTTRGTLDVNLPGDFPLSEPAAEQPNCRDHKLQMVMFRNGKLCVEKSVDQTNSGLGRLADQSPVVSVRVGPGPVSSLLTPVTLQFTLPRNKLPGQAHSCAYWDFSAKNGLGGWRRDGIVQLPARSGDGENVHRCTTSHLTHFAILADPSAVPVSAPQSLTYLSVIGCLFSLLGVTATFLTVLLPAFRRQLQSKVIASLCVALFGLLLFFLVSSLGSDVVVSSAVSLSGRGCMAVGILLHYFLLASFSWMLAEGIHVCRLVLGVFSAQAIDQRRLFVIMSTCAWGVPLVIVILTVLVSSDSYRESQICYVQGTALIVSVGVPLGVAGLANLIIFTTTICRILAHRQRVRRSTQIENGGEKSTRVSSSRARDMKSAMMLFLLLGVTWLLGAVVIASQHLVLLYIFTILNSLQGAGIFATQVLIRAKARHEWHRVLHLTCVGGDASAFPAPSFSSTVFSGWRRRSTLRRPWSERTTSRSWSLRTASTSGGSSRRSWSVHTASTSGGSSTRSNSCAIADEELKEKTAVAATGGARMSKKTVSVEHLKKDDVVSTLPGSSSMKVAEYLNTECSSSTTSDDTIASAERPDSPIHDDVDKELATAAPCTTDSDGINDVTARSFPEVNM